VAFLSYLLGQTNWEIIGWSSSSFPRPSWVGRANLTFPHPFFLPLFPRINGSINHETPPLTKRIITPTLRLTYVTQALYHNESKHCKTHILTAGIKRSLPPIQGYRYRSSPGRCWSRTIRFIHQLISASLSSSKVSIGRFGWSSESIWARCGAYFISRITSSWSTRFTLTFSYRR